MRPIVIHIVLALLLLVSIPTAHGNNHGGSFDILELPPVIDSYIEIIGQNTIISSNLTISNGGTLLIKDSHIIFDPTPYTKIEIYVANGGKLIINSSVIEGLWGKFLSIYVDNGGYASFYKSTFINLGWKTPYDTDEYIYPGPGFTNDLSRRGHGIEIAGIPTIISSNRFVNISSIRFYTSGMRVINNTIISPRHEGIAFLGSDNIVRNNSIIDASEQYREIHGIRFYPGSNNNTIEYNYIDNIPIGITVSQVDPWTKNSDYIIWGNIVRNAYIGINILARDTLIVDNKITNTFVYAMFVNDCENITIRGNILSNYTYVIPYMYTDEYWNEISHLFPNRDWYEFAIMQRGGLIISWRARNILIMNNTFSYAPIYGFGIAFDVRYSARNISIINNVFRHIADGYYIDEGGYISEPNLYSVPLSNIGKARGAAIELESTTDVNIESNRFIHVLNGISTAFPDAIGNYGNLSIKNNFFLGPKPTEWRLYYRDGYGPIMAIGVGTSAYRPEENMERKEIYNGKSLISITGNEIRSYIYPIVIDNRDSMRRTFIVNNNLIITFYKVVAEGAVAGLEDNILLDKVMPNMKALNIEVEPSQPTENEMVTIKMYVEITNLSILSMLMERTPIVKLYIDSVEVSTIRIDEDGIHMLTYTWDAVAGDHSIKFIIDPLNMIEETDETDNSQEISVTVEATGVPGGEQQPPGGGGAGEGEGIEEPTPGFPIVPLLVAALSIVVLVVAVIIKLRR